MRQALLAYLCKESLSKNFTNGHDFKKISLPKGPQLQRGPVEFGIQNVYKNSFFKINPERALHMRTSYRLVQVSKLGPLNLKSPDFHQLIPYQANHEH